MFGTIRKHQTWLWAIIITLTIISFVIFFSPYSKLNDSRGPANYGKISGERISEEQFAHAWREVQLRYFFMSGGKWPDEEAKRTGFDMEREVYQWLMLVQKQNQFGISVSSDMAAEVARDMLSQFQRAGINTLEAFSKQVLEPQGMTLADFERYLRHYVGLQELVAVLGTPGKLVTPQEAQGLYVREHQELSTEAVFFSASNFLSGVAINPAAITSYYTNHLADYRLPERVQVNYVEFGVSNLLGQAENEIGTTNLTELVDENFRQMGTNYTQLAKTPEEAKTKIRQELVRRRALNDAVKEAREFATKLFDMPSKPQSLDVLAKSNGLPVKVTAPFDRQFGPSDLKVSQSFVTAAFSLDPTNEPFGGPYPGQDGAYVIAFNRRLPSEVPSLDQIREKVVSDYRSSQAVMLARQAGFTAYPMLTNSLAQGKTFQEACASAKVQATNLPPFSISTRSLPASVEDHISLNELKQVAFSTPPGKLSTFQPTSDGAVILFVKAKLPIDAAKMKEDMPKFMAAVRQNRQSEAFNEWFRKVAPVALRDTPLGQPRPAPSMSSRPTGKKS